MALRGVREARSPRARRQVEVEQEGQERGAEEAPADRERALGAVRSRRPFHPRLRQAATTMVATTMVVATMTAAKTIEAMTR
jgi:hypothetical protein